MASSLIQNVIGATLPTIDRAEGVWLWDTAGRRYLDGCSGAVVTGIGHAHPHVVAAIAQQAARVTFTHRGAFTNSTLESVADRLVALTGFAGVWFVNSGSEAVEAAMHFVLQYFRERGENDRTRFLSADRGYHGNTLGALSASGHARRTTVRGLAVEVPAIPAAYSYGDQGDRTEAEYTADLLAQARLVFEEHGDTVAGLMIEPVGGATLGATVPPAGYLPGLKALCEEFGALFIADEVMTAFGRTGTMLAMEAEGVRADVVAIGKGLGAGYAPIAATLVDAAILDEITRGSGRILGGHTYAGNPLSAAAASAVLDVFENEDVMARGRRAGTLLRAGLEQIAAAHPIITDVRGRGILLGVEFAPATGALQGATAARIAAACMAEGLVIYPTTGGFIDAAQISPPLIISDDEIAELIARFDAALNRVELESTAASDPELQLGAVR
jgi:adenosylmethionine-8-amino-7-oxononanoate aminotransferase